MIIIGNQEGILLFDINGYRGTETGTEGYTTDDGGAFTLHLYTAAIANTEGNQLLLRNY